MKVTLQKPTDVDSSVDSNALTLRIEAPYTLGVGIALAAQLEGVYVIAVDRTGDGRSSSSWLLSIMVVGSRLEESNASRRGE